MKSKFFIILFLSSFLLGQGTMDPTYMASFGSVTINGKLYNQLSFRPEFSTNKIGIGFDIYLYFDEDGNLYKEDWDFSSTSASLKTIVDKIYYLRYGQPFDNLYFRVGSLPNVTLGQGILIKNYANNIDYPQIRRAGFDLRYQMSGFKFQFIHSDLKEVQKPGLIGFRAAIPIASNFDIGFSVASDFNQYNGLVDSDGDGYPDFVEPQWANDSNQWYAGQEFQDLNQAIFDDIYDITGAVYIDEDGNQFEFGQDGYIDTPDGQCDDIDNENCILLYNQLHAGDNTFNMNSEKNNMSGLSLDLGLRINDNLLIYSEYAQLLGETSDPTCSDSEDCIGVENSPEDFDATLGYGFIPIGISGDFGSFKFSMDYRRNSNNFIFGYWDKNYDHNRIMENNGSLITKESTLYQYGSQKGLNVGLEANVSKYFKFSMDYTKMKGSMWKMGTCDAGDYSTEIECESILWDHDNNIGTVDELGNWTYGGYQSDKNNSLYAKLEIDTSSIPQVQIAEIFYQQTNSDNPFSFKPNENTLIGYNIGIDLSNNMVVLLKGRKSYEFDGDDYKSVHSTQVETSIYF